MQVSSGLSAQQGASRSTEEICRELGAQLRWDSFFRSGVFTVQGHRLAFYSGASGERGPALMDGREIISVALPYLENGNLRFPENFVTPVKYTFGRYLEEDVTRFRIAAVIIDPGHGGKDPGAVGNHTVGGKSLKSVEKDITLDVGKSLYSLLSSAYPDKRILMTRDGDTYPSLEDRVAAAHSVTLKDNEAIIYVSVHANASLNKSARGYEVWYLSPEYRRTLVDKEKFTDSAEVAHIFNDMLEEEFTRESITIARFILNRFTETLGSAIPSRGLKAENWYVVRNARMPSILVELGFVTNQEDARLMADSAYLKKFSEALYKGIADFIEEFESSGGYIAP
ncbi:MAG: N-acetylmuramoyl-L-alanine amidase [Treponema sp.]|jgi:N-acetylmuramoyl-L-alanine amidase|nr:N-acetylmuramoyl-L-alanine amidase [Treponema sp.]